jgi:hypothetical protein
MRILAEVALLGIPKLLIEIDTKICRLLEGYTALS